MDSFDRKALTRFGIKSGFVEEQVEKIYQSLIAQYNLDEFEFLSPEYCAASDQKHEINMAYFRLKKPFSQYIINQESGIIKEEQMVDSIAKLIHDNIKSRKQVDNHFIATLVELLVSGKGLHEYVSDIEFHKYRTSGIAAYDRTNALKVYTYDLPNRCANFALEKDYYPYYKVVSWVGHEIEHANQRKVRQQKRGDVRTVIWNACEYNQDKADEFFDQVIMYPALLFFILNLIYKRRIKRIDKIYQKYWSYNPKERVADICGDSLVLSLIEQDSKKEVLSNIWNMFSEELLATLLGGYDQLLGPTDFYLSKFKQYEDCLRINEFSKSLSLEERLLLGLRVTSDELAEAKENKEKVLSVVRKIC